MAYVKAQQIQNNKTQTCLLLQYIQPLPIFFDLRHLSIPYPVTSAFLGHPVCPATKLTAFNKYDKCDKDDDDDDDDDDDVAQKFLNTKSKTFGTSYTLKMRNK